MDRGAWWAAIHGFTKSWTPLSMHACTHIIYSHHAVCFITTHGPFSHLLQASHMLTSSQHYTICFSNSGSLTLSSLPHQATRWGNCPFLPVFIPGPKLFAYTHLTQFSSVQFSCSVGLTLCNPMDCSMPGLPVHH